MDKLREQFEEWFNREKLSGITNESMIMVIRECMYEGWQASRAALVVQLPENGPPVFLNDYAEGVVAGADIYKAATEQALAKEGIKWK